MGERFCWESFPSEKMTAGAVGANQVFTPMFLTTLAGYGKISGRGLKSPQQQTVQVPLQVPQEGVRLVHKRLRPREPALVR